MWRLFSEHVAPGIDVRLESKTINDPPPITTPMLSLKQAREVQRHLSDTERTLLPHGMLTVVSHVFTQQEASRLLPAPGMVLSDGAAVEP